MLGKKNAQKNTPKKIHMKKKNSEKHVPQKISETSRKKWARRAPLFEAAGARNVFLVIGKNQN